MQFWVEVGQDFEHRGEHGFVARVLRAVISGYHKVPHRPSVFSFAVILKIKNNRVCCLFLCCGRFRLRKHKLPELDEHHADRADAGAEDDAADAA